MVQEIEQKFRLSDEAMTVSVLGRCSQLAIDEKVIVDQRDEYFDSTDEQLRQGDFTVRIRQDALRHFVALKGPRAYEDRGVSRRVELEVEVPDPSLVRGQMEAQGLIMTTVIEKRRQEFVIQNCLVAIDTVPFIGSFVEIEGPNVGAIEKVRLSLGLAATLAVAENYTELLEQKFLLIGRAIRPHLVATFDAEKGESGRLAPS